MIESCVLARKEDKNLRYGIYYSVEPDLTANEFRENSRRLDACRASSR